ncbi:MAG TPA: VWA domain-containing protein [Thermomicrobiaceae bacterium]|nr:VWA domain-containing protein [Thermomicrobiaceae bacterium]
MPGWLSRLLPTRADAETSRPATAVLPFTEVEGALALYVTALSGGTLRVNSAAGAARGSYADGRTIFLPPQVDLFADPAGARRLYRVTAAWKVLQVQAGGLELGPLVAAEPPGAALALYEVLHGEWLDRRLVARWPGLAADLALLRADALARRPTSDPSTASLPETLLRALLAHPLAAPVTAAALPDGPLADAWAREEVLAALGADDLEASRRAALALAPLAPPLAGTDPAPAVHYRGRIRPDLLARPAVTWEDDEATTKAGASSHRGARRDEPLVVEVRSPEQHQVRDRRASSGGGRHAIQLSLGDREPTFTFQQVALTEAEKVGATLYDEWDYRRGLYLPEWCAVRQGRPRGGNPEPVERILRRHAPLVKRLKEQFEALRPERQRLNRQLDGDDLDLDAMVDDHADRRAGFAPGEKLYSRTLERERNIALACLVDLSGSTGAWVDDDPRNDQVIEITRRALVFLSEALTVLDDRYAVFGFSGATRKRCEVSVVKGFDESYGETVKGRIAGLSPGSYTRIGPAVRHATQALTRQPARVRLLLLISDGRPNDFDGYGGRYGIEDTRKALIEARQKRVATFALTIDAEARDYMPHMFGRGHYVVVEDAPALATKLADVYRRLTVQ